MVTISRGRARGGGDATCTPILFLRLLLLAVVALLVAVFSHISSDSIDLGAASKYYHSDLSSSSASSSYVTSDAADHENALKVKEWRKGLAKDCLDAKSKEDVQAIGVRNKEAFALPAARHEQPREPARATKECRYTVLDFGANIGDTAGDTIDAGLFGCNRKDLGIELSDPKFDTQTGKIEEPKRGKRNPLTNWLVRLLKELSDKKGGEDALGPEDYCYYGIEGNPVFTDRLQVMEDMVMGMSPRPLKHLHFFTESVGAGEVGMTQLWLDTVNTAENFWGSSIFKGHQDVRKSAKENNTTEVAADVMGYTVSELMRTTLRAFDPAASEDEKKGGHLLLKVDIEGGEYPLLIEAANNGTVCEFVAMGNRADLFIEFHSQRVTGQNPLVRKKKESQEKLEKCGVQFRNLAAWWH